MLFSGALRDGRIRRLDRGGLGGLPADSDSLKVPSLIADSDIRRTLADTRSFHILPS